MKSNLSHILNREFTLRAKSNPRYSRNAFAKTLGISAPFLSHLLHNKRRLTPQTAQKIAKNLNLPPEETRTLIDESIGILPQTDSHTFERTLTSEEFGFLSEVWVVALLEYLSSQGDRTLHGITLAMKKSRSIIRATLERMISLGLIEKQGNIYVKKEKSRIFSSDTPNTHLRNFHSELLEKGKEALLTQSPSEKVVGSMTVSFSEADLPRVKKIMEEAQLKIGKIAFENKEKTEVYSMIFEFFRLTEKKKERK